MGLKLKTASNGSVSLEPTNTASDYTLTVPAQTGTVLATNSSGNVGINTTTPAVRLNGKTLSINGTESSQSYQSGIELLNNGASAGEIWANDVEMVVNAYYNKDLNFRTNNTFRMKIDSSGRVTMPYQPCFYAYGGPYQNTTNSVVQFTVAHTNRGSCYNTSTYRFTAPVTGAYTFHYTAMSDGGGYNRYVLRVNGSAIGGTMFASSDAYENFSGHWVVQLNANDYVDVFGTADVLIHPDYRTFSGYLIG